MIVNIMVRFTGIIEDFGIEFSALRRNSSNIWDMGLNSNRRISHHIFVISDA